MKIGWVSNAKIGHRSENQQNRFYRAINQAELDLLIVNGGLSNSGQDFYDYLKILSELDDIKANNVNVAFNLSVSDFKPDHSLESTISNSSKNHGERISPLVSNVIRSKTQRLCIVGSTGWFDGIGVKDGAFADEAYAFPDFNAISEIENAKLHCNEVAKSMIDCLLLGLEQAYELEPTKILIFTPFPGSEQSLNFGGKNQVPDDYKGLFLNRNLYPKINQIVSNHKRVKHFVFTGSPMGNNSQVIWPNLKEFVGARTFTNSEGQKDIALHTLEV